MYNKGMDFDTFRIGENVWEQVPRSDLEPHLLGDECWCEPRVSYGPEMPCHDGFFRPATIIAHNHRIQDIKRLASRLAPPTQGGIIKRTSNKGDNND